MIRAGFEAVNVRLDDMRDQMLQMHGENSERLDKINGRVGRAHELIASLQEAVATLKVEFAGIRQRWHDFRDSIAGAMRRPAGEGQVITQTQLGAVLGLIVAVGTIAVAVTLFILKH